VTEHTPTPWAYRPQKHDDWGWIRDADGGLAATARDGRVWSEQFDEYRAAGKDPYEPNATFIVKAVNNHDVLVSALQALVDNINDYERVNNLAPSPGRTECWDTVAHAKRILAAVESRAAPCPGCDGHECDNGCAYPGVSSPLSPSQSGSEK